MSVRQGRIERRRIAEVREREERRILQRTRNGDEGAILPEPWEEAEDPGRYKEGEEEDMMADQTEKQETDMASAEFDWALLEQRIYGTGLDPDIGMNMTREGASRLAGSLRLHYAVAGRS